MKLLTTSTTRLQLAADSGRLLIPIDVVRDLNLKKSERVKVTWRHDNYGDFSAKVEREK